MVLPRRLRPFRLAGCDRVDQRPMIAQGLLVQRELVGAGSAEEPFDVAKEYIVQHADEHRQGDIAGALDQHPVKFGRRPPDTRKILYARACMGPLIPEPRNNLRSDESREGEGWVQQWR